MLNSLSLSFNDLDDSNLKICLHELTTKIKSIYLFKGIKSYFLYLISNKVK